MIKLFKPDDFFNVEDGGRWGKITADQMEACARIANEILAKHMGPRVYETESTAGIESWIRYKPVSALREAYLFDIRPIEKKCKEHFPIKTCDNNYICAQCKKDIKPTGWTEA